MFNGLVALQIFAIFLILVTLVYFFRGEATYAQKVMLAFLIAELVHNAGYLLELFARTEREAMMAIKVQYMGSSIVTILFMMFICTYCGRKENKLVERTLLLCGCAVIIMVWTNASHHFYYRDVEFINDGVYPHMKLYYGPGFYFYFVTCVVIPWFISVLILVTSVCKERRIKRNKKLMFVVVGATVSLSVLLLYIFKVFPEGYDPTPLAMAILFSILVIFVWNRKDFDLSRTAANTVLNALGDSMITMDENYQILMYNDAAKQLFPKIDKYQEIKMLEGFPAHILNGEKLTKFEIGDKHYEGHMQTLMDAEQMVRGYTLTIVDVTDTYEYIEQLNEMRNQAEEANRAKSNFLANMSHEIRTPMNAVVGMSELIIEESRGRKIYDYACDIKTAALNLLSIINDILDLSKVESGKMELVEDEYYVEELIQDTVNLVKMAAEQKGLRIETKLNGEIPYKLFGDEGRIRQVLINIMNNSIKFTKVGYVRLEVSSSFIDDEYINLQFVINDTGIGIKEEDLALIFESFRQLDMNRNRKIEGTGLGLAITQQLVTLMQGDIQVESEYGKGTCFRIHIKQKVLDKKTIQDAPVMEKKQEPVKDKSFVCDSYRVLVVDDNIINRKVATTMLKLYGFQIEEAESGSEAIEAVKNQEFDMIFMDHMMPEMDGMEATRIIRADYSDRIKNTTMIALTANAIQGAREIYLENGFEDFLSKPFERSQLHEVLERWIPEEKRTYVETQE